MLNVGINRIDVNRHKIIKERGMHLAEVLSGKEKEYVLSIVETSKKFLDEIGDKNNVVLSPTSREWQTFKTAVKICVRTDFIKPAKSRIKDVKYPEMEDIEGVCNKCIKYEKYISLPGYDYYKMDDYEFCDECLAKWENSRSLRIYYVQEKRKSIIEEDFKRAVENTNFSDELIGNWMLAIRKNKQEKESKDIDNVLKEFIRDELMNEFANKNKQLIKKYQLWQNQ